MPAAATAAMAAPTLYRATLRAIREATSCGGMLRVRQPVLRGEVQWTGPQSMVVHETGPSLIGPVFPCLLSEDGDALVGGSELWGEGLPLELGRERACAVARHAYRAPHANAAAALDDGFSSLRALHEQARAPAFAPFILKSTSESTSVFAPQPSIIRRTPTLFHRSSWRRPRRSRGPRACAVRRAALL